MHHTHFTHLEETVLATGVAIGTITGVGGPAVDHLGDFIIHVDQMVNHIKEAYKAESGCCVVKEHNDVFAPQVVDRYKSIVANPEFRRSIPPDQPVIFDVFSTAISGLATDNRPTDSKTLTPPAIR